jgi:ParB-like chromosome segregation protein Spo0J
MTDVDVLETQLMENLQRDDLHPLEEAEGFEQLLKLEGRRPGADGSGPALTVDDLAAKLGKSKGYVYARLKLCALVPEARKAFHEGKLNPSTALLVARIPVPDLQKQAVKEITVGYRNNEPLSVRDAAAHIHERYMLRLAEAPWPTADAQLVPAAGPCTTCPKRTGNQRELFSDVASADVCTDPQCFAAKKKAWQAKVRLEAEAAGRTVITGKEAATRIPRTEATRPSSARRPRRPLSWRTPTPEICAK